MKLSLLLNPPPPWYVWGWTNMRALKVHVKKFQCFLIENENHMRKFITFITAICFRCVHRHHFTFFEYLKPVFVVNIYLMSIWWVFIVCRVEIKIWQTPTRWRVETLRLLLPVETRETVEKTLIELRLWFHHLFLYLLCNSCELTFDRSFMRLFNFCTKPKYGIISPSPSLPPHSSSSVTVRAASLVVVVAMAA